MTGSGTLLDPYIIENVTDLQAMENDLDAYYELGGNIDASATSGWNGGAGFIPIGQSGDGFTGQLDGKGYTIDSLFINRPATDFIGLISWTTGAVIKTVNLTNVNITGYNYVGALVGWTYLGCDIDNCSSAGSVSGRIVGGLIGGAWEDVTIDDSSSSCSVSGTFGGGFIYDTFDNVTITNCYATGNISIAVPNSSASGFVGWHETSAISKCYATGNATAPIASGNGAAAGGFVAYQRGGSITDCYARGAAEATIAGGFLCEGQLTVGTIDNCYSTGLLTAYVNGTNKGGFCWSNNAIVISNCFWDTETSGTAVSDGGTGKTTAQMKTESTFTDAGWDFITIWDIDGITNNGYPFLNPRAAAFIPKLFYF